MDEGGAKTMNIEFLFNIFVLVLLVLALFAFPWALKNPDKDTVLDKFFSKIFH